MRAGVVDRLALLEQLDRPVDVLRFPASARIAETQRYRARSNTVKRHRRRLIVGVHFRVRFVFFVRFGMVGLPGDHRGPERAAFAYGLRTDTLELRRKRLGLPREHARVVPTPTNRQPS